MSPAGIAAALPTQACHLLEGRLTAQAPSARTFAAGMGRKCHLTFRYTIRIFGIQSNFICVKVLRCFMSDQAAFIAQDRYTIDPNEACR